MAQCYQEPQTGGVEPMEVDDDEAGGGGEGYEGTNGQAAGAEWLPSHWIKMPPDVPALAVSLSSQGEEYNTVLAFFLDSFSLPSVDVVRIFRIQNSFLFRHYLLKREEMKHEHGRCDLLNERRLFHGTRTSHIDGICRKGFDWRLSARTKYGDGCYFARKSSYSHGYSPCTEARLDYPTTIQQAVCPSSSPSDSHHPQGHLHHSQSWPSAALRPNKPPPTLMPEYRRSQPLSLPPCWRLLDINSKTTVPPSPTSSSSSSSFSTPGALGLRYMLVSRVLVGRSVKGHSDYRRPPALKLGDPNSGTFDSCVDCDGEREPSIFVIFDSNQAYPEYLLEYTCPID